MKYCFSILYSLKGISPAASASGQGQGDGKQSSPILERKPGNSNYQSVRSYQDHADNFSPSLIRGHDFVRDPKLNKVTKI